VNEETLTQPNAAHTAQLALCGSKVAKVRYACESLVRPSTSDVLAFLVTHGVVTDAKRERSYVSTQVTKWRKERGQGDTDDVPPMSDEMLAALDSLREQATVSTNSPAEQASERVNVNVPAVIDVHVNSEHVNTDGLAVVVDEHVNSAEAVVREHVNVPAERESEHTNTPPAPAFTNTRVLPTTEPKRPAGVLGFYLVAAMSLLVSADTSWRFFGDVLLITNGLEHVAMFAIVEAALIACGWAMKAAVRGPTHKPGPTRVILWALCGLSAYMAMDLSGLGPGIARVALGPVLGVIMLHLALGIEIRHTRQGDTMWARVGREYRERFLSRVGLADDARDAAERTRYRAARRAAQLAKAGPLTPFRKARVRRALRLAEVAHREHMQDVMLAEIATVDNADGLADLKLPAPWARG
jgi:hypothetical protein